MSTVPVADANRCPSLWVRCPPPSPQMRILYPSAGPVEAAGNESRCRVACLYHSNRQAGPWRVGWGGVLGCLSGLLSAGPLMSNHNGSLWISVPVSSLAQPSLICLQFVRGQLKHAHLLRVPMNAPACAEACLHKHLSSLVGRERHYTC